MEESEQSSSIRDRHCSSCLQRETELPVLSHFRSLTPEKASQVAHIDAGVQHTHDTIIELLHQRAALIRQRNTFVPAVNLPPEVLTTIFEFACGSDSDARIANVGLEPPHDYYRNGCSDSAHTVTPLFIGSICSAWRSVAWGAPQLWKSITLLYNDDNAEIHAEILEYWLAKSGNLPLSVALLEDGFGYVASTSFKAMDVITAYAHRLHTLDLFLPSAWEPALIRIASRTPSLACLTLRACESATASHANSSIQLTNIFAGASQLREVALFGYSIEEVLLPWAHLESLEVDSGYDDADKVAETLRLCPRLRRFSIYLGDRIWTGPPSVLTRHTAIEVFEVSGYSEGAHPEFLRTLELPALRSFVLQVSVMLSKWSSWLMPFLSRVAGTLENLQLFSTSPIAEEVSILRVVPRLRKLVLLNSFRNLGQEKMLTQRTLDLMNPIKSEELECEVNGQSDGQSDGTAGLDERGNGHCLVPNLETFEYEGKVDFTSHALVEFLVARWHGGSTRCTSVFGLENPHRQVEGSGQQAARETLPPNIDAPSARLRSATFKTQKQIRFENADAEVVQELRLAGMHLEFWATR